LTGDPAVVKQGLEMLRVGGKYILLGAIYPDSNITIDVSQIMLKCIQIYGMHNYHPTNLKKAIELVNASKKKFPYEKLVGPNFQLSVQGVEDALASLNSKKSIRPAIINN
jgi:threonine dehydrogenase-like Zn-dependent dehydrogenase